MDLLRLLENDNTGRRHEDIDRIRAEEIVVPDLDMHPTSGRPKLHLFRPLLSSVEMMGLMEEAFTQLSHSMLTAEHQ